MYVKRNTGARSRNRCCRGKAISTPVIYWVRVCNPTYPACKAHAPYCMVICVLSGCTMFFDIIS